MRLAHETAADQADADALHVCSLEDFVFSRGGGFVKGAGVPRKTEQKLRIAISPNVYSILTPASKR
jgi:hypothetical protein